MRVSSGNDAIDGFNDAVERRVRPDGHVRAAEVVVDGSDETHDVQVSMLLHLMTILIKSWNLDVKKLIAGPIFETIFAILYSSFLKNTFKRSIASNIDIQNLFEVYDTSQV